MHKVSQAMIGLGRQRFIVLAAGAVLALWGLLFTSAVPASAGVACPYTYCGSTSTLYGGNTLQPGDWIASTNKVFAFDMQSDSNLVLYDAAHEAHWASGTWWRPSGGWLAMQTDGNLVIYRAGGTCYCSADAYWASGTNGHPGAYVIMQNDGNAVIYDNQGHALWASNTWTYTTSMGATESSYGKPDNGIASNGMGSRGAGSAVHIWCQTNVGADTGHGYNTAGNFTWDHIAEGGWVPDYYVNTPVVGSDDYSSGVPRCHRSGPLTVTGTIANDLASYPATPGQAWVVPGNHHTIGPLFNDGGDYWQSVQAESTGSALGSGACQDLVLANSNFWWLFDAVNGGGILNNVDTWGPDSGGGTDPSNGVYYSGHGRVWAVSNPQVGDIVVFGHVQGWTPNGHVASVIRVDGDGFVIAEFNFFQNGGGTGILDFRKVTSSTPDHVIAFIR